MGFIPNDQEQFFQAMKQMIEQHRKDQSNKQQIAQQQQQQKVSR